MKKSFVISFLLGGAVLGVILVLQIKADKPLIGSFPVDEMEAREELIDEFLDEQSYLQKRIVALRTQINEYQDEIQEQSASFNLDLLDTLKETIGLSEVHGDGLYVMLDDSPFAQREGANVTDAELVQASDIRDLINALNASHADAISVNNQRITASTAISSVGSNILVNNAHIAPPITIRAIGDKKVLMQGLGNQSLLGGLYLRINNSNVEFEVEAGNSIVIPMYNGDFKADHINLIEE